MGSTRKEPDGVETTPATEGDIATYHRAGEDILRMQIPQFLRQDDPHDRLFVAGLDGTGNSMYKQEAHRHSVIADIFKEIDALRDGGRRDIAGGYVQGTYTQDNWLVRASDGAFGHSFDERVETAYWQLCKQAYKWLKEDPQATIHVVVTGFSRGAEQAAALTRLIHERGIMDPDSAQVRWNERERIVTGISYRGEPLVPPGQTLQAAMLYDPVSTGVTHHDRRLAPSVVSALQFTARDEPRDQFRSNQIVEPGTSRDRRYLNALLPGAHSDLADTYLVNGLGTLGHNLGVAYLNRFSDRPLLETRPPPEDPAMYAIHRSEQHSRLWTTHEFRRDGRRDLRDDLAPPSACQPRKAPACRLAEPTDPALLQRAERLMPGSKPGPGIAKDDTEIDAIFERLARAAMHGDRAAMKAAVDDWRASPDGLAAAQEGRAHLERLQAAEHTGAMRPQQAPEYAPQVH